MVLEAKAKEKRRSYIGEMRLEEKKKKKSKECRQMRTGKYVSSIEWMDAIERENQIKSCT